MIRLFIALAAAGIFFLTAMAEERGISLLPEPVKMELGKGFFVLGEDTEIAAEGELGPMLQALLEPATGFPLAFTSAKDAKDDTITLFRDPALEALGEEGYRLEVMRRSVVISAPAEAGLFYGMQTLRQLLPPQIFENTPADSVEWKVPCVLIEDYPRFKWRGAMLDVCRHFMPKEFVLRFMDLMALHKLNRFHLHLTEDQGWRMEIKKYPKLTEVGAWRKETLAGHYSQKPHTYDGLRHGGYYTQDDLREMVAYGQARHITIVPEIEMPGHAQAAIAAYPELGCTDEQLPVRTVWGVNKNIFNADEETILFLQDVLREVMELFPGEFIHIGGDEVPKDQWKASDKTQARMRALNLSNEHELQSYFIRRMDEFLTSNGRRLIGWDEILEGGLAPNAAVMSWRGDTGGIEAARMGHDVVMAPTHSTYFDYYQSREPGEPLAIGGFLPLSQVYEYEPIPMDLTAKEAKHILGTQGQLWTEYIKTPEKVEYMGFPRLCALAEVAWSFKSQRDFNAFLDRLKVHFERLDALNVHYRPLDEKWIVGRWKSGDTSQMYRVMEWDLTQWLKKPGTYEVRFQYTGGAHRLDIEWVEIVSRGSTMARDAHKGITGTADENNLYSLLVEHTDPDSRYLLVASVRSDGGTDSNGEIRMERKQGEYLK